MTDVPHVVREWLKFVCRCIFPASDEVDDNQYEMENPLHGTGFLGNVNRTALEIEFGPISTNLVIPGNDNIILTNSPIELDKIREIINTHSIIAEIAERPREKCLICAELIEDTLQKNSVMFKSLGILIWTSQQDEFPTNHFVTVINIDGNEYAIDPTKEQFSREPTVLSDEYVIILADWRKEFREIMRNYIIKYKEYPSSSVAFADVGFKTLFSSKFNGDFM